MFYSEYKNIHLYSDSGCTLTEKINSRTGNGLDKIWIADFIPLSESEEGFLDGLGYSPVAFSCLIGDGLMAYSGGIYIKSGMYKFMIYKVGFS